MHADHDNHDTGNFGEQLKIFSDQLADGRGSRPECDKDGRKTENEGQRGQNHFTIDVWRYLALA